MTTFQDGPAKDTVLVLGRAPLYLRVVKDGDKIDALDKLDDRPEANETIHVYKRVGEPGMAHMDGRDPKTGKRFGRTCVIARYAICAGPGDGVCRNNSQWQAWCVERARA